MTTDYASLDEAIVKAILDGESVLLPIKWHLHRRSQVIVTEDEALQRLQSLRKRGIIEYNNGRWSALEKV